MTQARVINCFGSTVALLSALAVAGCGWAEWPPKGYKGGYQSNQKTTQRTSQHQSSRSQTSAPPSRYQANRQPPPVKQRTVKPTRAPLRGGGDVHVARNDTVYAISRRYGVSMRAIIEANRLQPPYALRVGRRLSIPAVREHRVRSGETLSAIAQTYGVSVYTLARRNHLRSPYRVISGQTLIVAQAVTPQRSSRTVSNAKTSDRGPVVKTAPLLRIQSPQVPSAQRVKAAPVPLPKPKPKVGAAEPVRKVRVVSTVPKRVFRNTRGFMWPLQGRLISGFGPKAKGLYNDGINIAAPRGAPVRAAKGGVVAYAGNELRGFGNLLLIKHTNGWVTAYAHTDKILVKRGDRVGKGQIIARVGKTGAVSRPQLHFEMRRGKRPVNPKRFLRPA